MVPETPTKKFSIVDVRCVDNYKSQFIVEIQTYWYEAFMKRIVFNAGKAYVRQLDRSEKYHLLQPVYTLAILTEDFDHQTPQFYHHYKIINCENSNEIIPGLEFVLVELTDKFRPETITDRKLMVLWLRFLREVNEDMRELPAEMRENKDILKAAELCEEGAFTAAELARYDGFWDAVRVEKTVIYSATEKGRAEGRAEGRTEGRAEGRTEGRVEGRTEGIYEKAVDVAIKAIRKGMTVKEAGELSGLDEEDITKIIKNLKK
jgi:predicted transposase/invertase (TIGR01784 family)